MSQASRYEQNLAVLAQLKRGHVNVDLLKSYTGWGGLRDAVYTPDIYRQLKEVLSSTEIMSLKKTLNSAYYTPKPLINFMYAFLDSLNFKATKILEPAIGTGAFIEHMPDSLRQASRITGVEIDSVSASICKALYPEINLHITGFEAFQPKQGYDLIIGNPPYSNQVLTDIEHIDLKHHAIHHYFAAKCMRLLNEGGILAFVLPAFFMDNENKHVRDIIALEGGSLISAYRLPDDLFSDAKVTVDIVFLKKDKNNNFNNPAWTKTVKTCVSGYRLSINEYYAANPHHIMGRLDVVDMYGRKGLTCKKDTENCFEKLNGLIEKKSQASQGKIMPETLKESISALRQELHGLSQALIMTGQKFSDMSEKISYFETLL